MAAYNSFNQFFEDLELSGQDVVTLYDRVMMAEKGELELDGQPTTLAGHRILEVEKGLLELVGQSATVGIPGSFLIEAEKGEIGLVGYPLGVDADLYVGRFRIRRARKEQNVPYLRVGR